MAAEKVAWRVKQQSTSYPSDNNTDECEDDDIHEREGDDKYGHYVLDIGIKAIKIRRIWAEYIRIYNSLRLVNHQYIT
ncbi:hypothetical protein DFH94DRAFT_691804 [Russula ochroleuca]|uniref:Uncharacterized protein n=1 Tax=Russula ochroleuca TaxID=152965 RepID=A0A9P5MWW0_9AGAM|nr:hypothetical protein DFH94DRAFT_691804 [Russula ochroleuca]